MPYCPSCGHQHAADDRFCARCGRALTPDTVPPAPPQPPSTLPAPPPPSLPPAPVAEQLIWEGTPHGLLNPIESHAIRWELTTERLRVVRGLLNRSTEEVELTRVRDVSCEQSLAQRALGIGNVTVVSADTTTPTLVLHDVADPEQVRQAVREQRRRLRVRQLEVDEQL